MVILILIIIFAVVAMLLFSGKDRQTVKLSSFDIAFQKRIGLDPVSYLDEKIATGSDIEAIKYLFEVIAAEIELKEHCKSPGFDFYYAKTVGARSAAIPVRNKPQNVPIQNTTTNNAQRHRWTFEEDVICCRRFFEQYVMLQSSMDLSQFAEQLHRTLPEISVGSLRMKTQNIKQLCVEQGIRNSLAAKPLSQYSQQNYRAFMQVKKELGF